MSGFHATRDERSAAWFDALAQGRLLIRRCDRCGHLGAPDRFACSACLADDLDWVPASGAGTLLARIVDRTNGFRRGPGLDRTRRGTVALGADNRTCRGRNIAC